MLGPSRRLDQDVAAALLDGKGIRHNGAGTASDGGGGGTPQLSPSVVVIIVLITVVFFLSGFLHLLARCFTRPASNRSGPRPQNSSGSLTQQGQLQDLFHQHDSGVEQAFIEALPVFYYRSVRGLKEGADCAVCLNEFSGDDRLRLLPKCSHAFHLECIDTWLLSHSTCPLCRCSLAPDSSSASGYGYGIRVESFGRSSVTSGGGSGAASFAADSVSSAAADRCLQEQQQQQSQPQPQEAGHEPRLMVPVKLGRFCPSATDPSANISSLSRRSYSMGSYDYVLDSSAGGDQAALVVIAPTPLHRKWKPPGTPGHRSVLSECILEESGNGSPWMTIDVNSTKQQQQQEPGHSLLSWVPWRSRGSSGQGSSRSFSFRLPFQISSSSSSQQQQQHQQQQGQEVGEERHIWWWKNPGGASRRSLCESVVPSEQLVQHQAPATTNHGSSACSQWDQGSVCSTNADLKSTGSAASSAGSIARRTLRWLMGRDRTPRVSVEDVAPSF